MLIQNLNSNSGGVKGSSTQMVKSIEIEKNQFSISSNKKSTEKFTKTKNETSQNQNEDKHTKKQIFLSIENKPLEKLKQRQQNIFKISKSSSQPKIRTFKQQILKIPKVKQILQKDKFVFIHDIEKRLQLMGDVKNQNFKEKQVVGLNQLRKPIQQGKKKNRRHKTNYKIPLTKKNINSLNNLIQQHISHNQRYKNEQFVFLSQNDYKEPFDLRKLKFMDQINPLKKKYKQKFPDLKEGVLSKNKLLLEHVILSRNVKREMKIQQKKAKKQALKQKQLAKKIIQEDKR